MQEDLSIYYNNAFGERKRVQFFVWDDSKQVSVSRFSKGMKKKCFQSVSEYVKLHEI